MTTATHAPSPARPQWTPARWAVGAVVATAAAGVINALLARVAIAAGADPSFGPFGLGATTGFTALGVLAGFTGWLAVRHWIRRAATVLTVLVPVLTVLSLIPDLAFFNPNSRAGAGPVAAVALMAMHLVVVAIAVTTYQRVAPVNR